MELREKTKKKIDAWSTNISHISKFPRLSLTVKKNFAPSIQYCSCAVVQMSLVRNSANFFH